MNNLIIEQNTTSIETVTSEVIEKLYNLAITSNVADENNNFPMSLKGTLTAISAFRDSVQYLRDKFPQLTITVQDNAYYIRFADNNVYQTLNNAGYGDGIGITEFEASTIKFGNLFKGNTSITSFNEFSYFTTQQNNNSFSFQDCTNLTSIDLSNAKTLYDSCLRNTGLIEVNDLGTVTNLPNDCFRYCTRLTHINLPETCIKIGKGVFWDCNSLSFDLNDLYYVQEFDGNRERGCLEINSNNGIPINYPDNDKVLYLPNATKIGARSFRHHSMKEINLPNLNVISCHATFANCQSLKKVTSLGQSHIDPYFDMYYATNGMFSDCSQLQEVNIPSTWTIVPPRLFYNCSNLEIINWDFSVVTYIATQAFSGCSKFPNVMYLPNVTQVGYPSTAGEKAIIPNPIGDSTFITPKAYGIFKGSSIKNVYLPKAKLLPLDRPEVYSQEIPTPDGVFTDTQLNVVYLRDVQSIGMGNFYKATINTLIINNTTVPDFVPFDSTTVRNFNNADWILNKYNNYPNYNTDLFYNTTSIQNIYVPDTAVSSYQNNSYFSSMASIIKPLSQCPRKTLQEVQNGEIGLIEAYM